MAEGPTSAKKRSIHSKPGGWMSGGVDAETELPFAAGDRGDHEGLECHGKVVQYVRCDRISGAEGSRAVVCAQRERG